MPAPICRVEFLGRSAPGGSLLARAAAHLVEDLEGPLDLGDVLVAVPGARAGRALLGHLARAMAARGWTGFFPPRVLTQGRLVDELVELDLPVADRVTRTLAWERALRGAPWSTLGPIAAHPPAATDASGWWRLAEQVRSVHAELAVEARDFAGVAAQLEGEGASSGEVRRWQALAEVQGAWRASLDECGLLDPHEGRRAAVDSGAVRRDARVVMVGIAEVGDMLRAALSALREPARALMFAEESEGSLFDGAGALLPEAWARRDVPLPLDRWHVAGGPDEQARRAVSLAAEEGGPTRADELVIGVPDDEVIPYLERRLAATGIRARDAAGTPFDRTAPARLISLLEAFLRTRSFEDLAALLRHADLDRVLAARLDHDPVARLDAYRAAALPRRVVEGPADVPPRVRRRADPRELLEALGGLLGGLVASGPTEAHELPHQVEQLAAFLERVYGEHPLLDPDASFEGERAEHARALRASWAAVRGALRALPELPPRLAGRVTAAASCDLVRRAAAADGDVPPAPSGADEPTVELLGWLELLLDDAPFAVVTGFNEGRVPESSETDSLLPDSLRARLGLPCDERRQARDHHLLAGLLASGKDVHFVSGRRTRDGDPLFPSRLAFAAPEAEAVERVRHAQREARFAPTEREDAGPVMLPPVVQPREAPEVFTVTSFSQHLESPILFHLRRQLRLETVDDRAAELDALGFGNLAHDVLEAFGRSALKASPDADAIEGFLVDRLHRARAERFPASVLASVPLQMRQLERRFQEFAAFQARRAREGWSIEAVEWSPGLDVPEGEEVDGRRRGMVRLDMGADEAPVWIKGKIDRIERHTNGSWSVIDYKTGHKAKKPKDVRTRDGTWKDLQLPLYALLVQELTGGALPELGYVNLPGDGTRAGLEILSGSWWHLDELDRALDAARDVVRAVRAGELSEHGKLRRLPALEEELLGVGLVVAPSTDDDEEERA